MFRGAQISAQLIITTGHLLSSWLGRLETWDTISKSQSKIFCRLLFLGRQKLFYKNGAWNKHSIVHKNPVFR